MTEKQAFWTARRILWTAGVGFAGFFIAGKGGGILGADLGLAWGAAIGFGFGSIFDQTQPARRVVAYWVATMALVGPLFGLIIGAGFLTYDSDVEMIAAGVIGSVVGMLLGYLMGTMQLRRVRKFAPPSV